MYEYSTAQYSTTFRPHALFGIVKLQCTVVKCTVQNKYFANILVPHYPAREVVSISQSV